MSKYKVPETSSGCRWRALPSLRAGFAHNYSQYTSKRRTNRGFYPPPEVQKLYYKRVLGYVLIIEITHFFHNLKCPYLKTKQLYIIPLYNLYST
jgi:hypothetical protein